MLYGIVHDYESMFTTEKINHNLTRPIIPVRIKLIGIFNFHPDPMAF